MPSRQRVFLPIDSTTKKMFFAGHPFNFGRLQFTLPRDKHAMKTFFLQAAKLNKAEKKRVNLSCFYKLFFQKQTNFMYFQIITAHNKFFVKDIFRKLEQIGRKV